MRAGLLMAGLVVLAGIAVGTPSARGSQEGMAVLLPGSPLEGSQLFASKGCIGCHAVHGAGGTAGPDLGRGILKRPLLDIAAVMWNHTPGMEHQFQEKRLTRPTFEPAQMASLLAFLYYLGSLDPPGDADRGAVLFRQKGCQTCHTVGGQGGRVGPDLTKYSRYASPLFLTAALWNRGRAMARVMERERITRATFEGSDIPDLLAYIRSGGSGTERVYAPPGSPKRGEALFTQKRCVECHSVRGRGGKIGPDLATSIKGSLTQIAGAMWNHGPRMWAKMDERGIQVPPLDSQEMSDLVSYLYFLQFIDPPGDARRGAAVYKEKRCGRCHGSPGTKLVAPALTSVVLKLKTPLAVVTAMWNHAGQMTETTLEKNVVWPVRKGGEMADLMAYLLGGVQADGSTSGARASGAARTKKGPVPTK
jgi:mono/diheme cytochrome c family protein